MRLIKHGRNYPYILKLGELPQFKNSDDKTKNTELHMCACGLSRHKPFCDGSHMKVSKEEPDKLFAYDGEEKKELNESNAFAIVKHLPNEYE
jgi:CDGSH-type Zn-finger protein